MKDKIKEILLTTFFSTLFGGICSFLKISNIFIFAMITTLGGVLGLLLSTLKFHQKQILTLKIYKYNWIDLTLLIVWILLSLFLYFRLSDIFSSISPKIFALLIRKEISYSILEIKMQNYQIMGTILFYLSLVIMTIKEYYEDYTSSEIENIYTIAPLISFFIFNLFFIIFAIIGRYFDLEINNFILIIPYLPTLVISLIFIKYNQRQNNFR